jgi:cardiolipin synthase
VATAFATAFEEHWQSQGCKGSLGTAAANPPPNAGPRTVQLLLSHPQDERNRIYDSLLKAIDASQRSVHLTMAYFAPGDDMAQALCDAARRGVDVVLILPSRSDFTLMLSAGRAYYQHLLDCGVKIHEMQDALLHAKTAVIDGVWSTVGSSNLDWRSFVINSEVNVVVLGDDFGQSLEQLFQKDLAASSPIRPEEWANRGLGARVKEQLGRIVERLL